MPDSGNSSQTDARRRHRRDHGPTPSRPVGRTGLPANGPARSSSSSSSPSIRAKVKCAAMAWPKRLKRREVDCWHCFGGASFSICNHVMEERDTPASISRGDDFLPARPGVHGDGVGELCSGGVGGELLVRLPRVSGRYRAALPFGVCDDAAIHGPKPPVAQRLPNSFSYLGMNSSRPLRAEVRKDPTTKTLRVTGRTLAPFFAPNGMRMGGERQGV